MYISHKSNVLQHIHETEWQCRRNTKGQTKAEYWVWLDSVTSGDPPVVDLSGETGYVIIECTDEDVSARLNQLGDYSADGVYNIKYYTAKRNAEEIKDFEGNSHSPKQYVSSHFVGDNTAKDARLLADKWVAVRRDRDIRLAETDFYALSDATLADNMKTYRQGLRDVPADNADVDNITWPTKP